MLKYPKYLGVSYVTWCVWCLCEEEWWCVTCGINIYIINKILCVRSTKVGISRIIGLPQMYGELVLIVHGQVTVRR